MKQYDEVSTLRDQLTDIENELEAVCADRDELQEKADCVESLERDVERLKTSNCNSGIT